jgi:hypothetical protein
MLSENLLAVHVNYLGRQDAALLGKRRVSVAHCARSHCYFRHQPFPLRALRRARVNICLGTDSLASVYKTARQTLELNMFEEMRAVAGAEGVPPEAVMKSLAGGTAVIPHNRRHRIARLCGIGKGLRTKVNANIGTSAESMDPKVEVQKARIVERYGADTVTDLSMGGKIRGSDSALLEGNRNRPPSGTSLFGPGGGLLQHGPRAGLREILQAGPLQPGSHE